MASYITPKCFQFFNRGISFRFIVYFPISQKNFWGSFKNILLYLKKFAYFSYLCIRWAVNWIFSSVFFYYRDLSIDDFLCFLFFLLSLFSLWNSYSFYQVWIFLFYLFYFFFNPWFPFKLLKVILFMFHDNWVMATAYYCNHWIYYYFIFCSFLTSALTDGFHWSLSDNKSPRISKILLIILTDLKCFVDKLISILLFSSCLFSSCL